MARLRARIGVPEPNPAPPRYRCPNTDAFRQVAEAYGDDNPLWCDPAYAAATRWAGPLAPPALVGGDSLIGEDEVREVAAEHRELLRGDPLRGVHAYYSASAREWWSPLRPDRRLHRRNALVGVLDKASEFAKRLGARVDGTGVPRRRDAPRRAAAAHGPHRARRGPGTGQRTRPGRPGALHRRAAGGDRRAVRAGATAGRRPPLVGGRRGGRRARPAGEGPPHGDRHDLLARRDGDGPVPASRRCGSATRTGGGSPASTTATS